MVSSEESRRVLEALLATYPDEGVILGLRLRAGWGGTLQIEIDTGYEPGTSRAVERRVEGQIREAIAGALPSSRRVVPITPLNHFGGASSPL